MPPYPGCEGTRSHQVHTNCGETPHFLLGFWGELLAPLQRQKAFSLTFAEGKFHPLKFPLALFLRPGQAQLVPLLEEDHMDLFSSCRILHWVILLSVGLHLPFYTPKVVASYFDETPLISVGSHAQGTTG